MLFAVLLLIAHNYTLSVNVLRSQGSKDKGNLMSAFIVIKLAYSVPRKCLVIYTLKLWLFEVK